ncbi:hypothetical protein RHSIM_RhsimUnG0051900 [Rhododendron simsii]|uniref:Uncharacterized protein n=1 Tax=Rhododendron simsii TaxID=118357 RepID=A0A834FVY4_RHOSS|nr:hypothetical protein RHSIM_RhsimUnG0051900 [Rhododendron simsii]
MFCSGMMELSFLSSMDPLPGTSVRTDCQSKGRITRRSSSRSVMLFCRSDQEVRATRRQRTGRKLGKAVVRSVFWLRGPSKGKEAASRSGSKAQENVLEIIGITTKAVKMALPQVFEEFPDIVRLQAFADVENLKKIGFLKEGHLRKYTYVKGNLKGLVCTQRSWKWPYGVGLLVAGLDESRAHLYYNCPSGNYFEYQAFAIGSRSQAAKTYLERRFKSFVSSLREDLLKDALFALRETLQGEKLNSSTCTVAVVGVGEAFHVLDNESVQSLIDAFEIVGEEVPPAEEEGAAAEPAADGQCATAEEGAAPMDI